MKGKLLKRMLSAAMTAVMLVSMFAVGAITASAAPTDEVTAVKFIMSGVTRKNKLAVDICEEINSRRSTKLAADADLFDECMERAAQLSLRFSFADLVDDNYTSNDGSYYYYEAETLIDDYKDTTSVSSIVDNILASSKLSIGGKETVESAEVNEIGVGAVIVREKSNETTSSKKLYVCVRTTNEKTNNNVTVKAPSYTEDTETVCQATSMLKGFICQDSIGVRDVETDVISNTIATFEGGKQYQLLLRLKNYEGPLTSYAYVIPKLVSGAINYKGMDSGIDYLSSVLYRDSVGGNKYFTIRSSDPKIRMQLEGHSWSGETAESYFQEITLNCTISGEKTFTAEDVELEYYSVVHNNDNSVKYCPKVLSVKDHNTGDVLEAGKDYIDPMDDPTWYYSGCYPETQPRVAKVDIEGINDYYGVLVTIEYTLYPPATEYTVGMDLVVDRNTIYAGDRVEVDAIASTGSEYTFVCKDSAGKIIEGTKDGHRFIFYPPESGTYTVGVTAVNGDKAATNSVTVDVVGEFNVEMTSSNMTPDVGEEFTLTAKISGGVAPYTYVFRDSNGQAVSTISDTTETTATAKASSVNAGDRTFRVSVTDKAGTTKIASVTMNFKEVEVKPTVVGRSLTLKGDIGVNVYMKLPNNTCKVVLNGTKGKQEHIASEGYISTGDDIGKYLFSYCVAASDMDEDVTVQVFTADGVQTELYNSENKRCENDTYTTTISSYLDYVAKNPDKYSDDMKDLCKSMYTFGSYSDKYFDGGSLEGKELEEISSVTKDNLAGFETVTSGTAPEGVTVRGYTLVLEDMTSFRLYLKYTGKKPTVTSGNNTLTIKSSSLGNYVEIADIPASKLNSDLSFVISNGTDSLTVTTPPLTYARLVLEKYDNETYKDNEEIVNLCNVVKSLYLYYQASYKYFKTT